MGFFQTHLLARWRGRGYAGRGVKDGLGRCFGRLPVVRGQAVYAFGWFANGWLRECVPCLLGPEPEGAGRVHRARRLSTHPLPDGVPARNGQGADRANIRLGGACQVHGRDVEAHPWLNPGAPVGQRRPGGGGKACANRPAPVLPQVTQTVHNVKRNVPNTAHPYPLMLSLSKHDLALRQAQDERCWLGPGLLHPTGSQ